MAACTRLLLHHLDSQRYGTGSMEVITVMIMDMWTGLDFDVFFGEGRYGGGERERERWIRDIAVVWLLNTVLHPVLLCLWTWMVFFWGEG